ncbi:MAG: MarR family transcriptional regulator [Oscillospiraceae bacterium]
MNEQQIATKLISALRDTNHMIRNMHLKIDQSFGDWRILNMIQHHLKVTGEGMKVTTIADILKVSLPTVSQKVADFEQQGYIYRKQSTTDRRVCYLLLTEKGEAITKQSCELLMNKCETVIGSFGEENAVQLCELLQKFKDCLEATEI